ncbi:MAG: ABC transporter substrate-binding protein [Clostridiales bacterium]|nr:ABC transporter substrate-binding protein [Clostridiales bacterium]
MKKLVSFVCAAAFACAAALPLTACGNDEGDETIHVYMPDGAPAIALASLMDGGYSGFDFTVVPSNEIGGVVSNGTADMAIMPIDAAANLYNGGKDIVMLSVNTHGNLYMVGKTEDATFADLEGKRLGVIGQGSVPDNTLRILLNKENISYQISEDEIEDKIAVTYADASTLIPLFKQGKLDYILLGEPAVTNAINATKDIGGKIAMDMQEQWKLAFGGSFPQACLIAKGSVIDNRKADVNKFLTALKESDGWAEQNPDKALKAVENNMKTGNQTTLKALTEDIIKRCNIKTVAADDIREDCDTYFQKLRTLRADALDTPVLAKVPDLDFYYQS